jgi:predicted nucleic acid-binding protein
VIVVDANVLVHFYHFGEHTSAAASLLEEDPNWVAPVLWRSEFRNALVTHVRLGGLTLDLALRIQDEAEGLMSGGEYDVDSDAVLRLAESSGCSAYDCEYVALAQKLRVRLVTQDKQVLSAFPEVATAL